MAPGLGRRGQDVGAVAVNEVVQDFLAGPALGQHLPYYGAHLEGDFHLGLVNGLGGADRAHDHLVNGLRLPLQTLIAAVCAESVGGRQRRDW